MNKFEAIGEGEIDDVDQLRIACGEAVTEGGEAAAASEIRAAADRSDKRAFVEIVEFAANGHAMREPRDLARRAAPKGR